MKHSAFLLFFGIVFIIYSLVNFYIVRRGWLAFSGSCRLRTVFLVVMLLLAIAYPLSRFLEHSALRSLSVPLVHVGAYYLAAMVFLLFLLLGADVLRGLGRLLHLLPQGWRDWGGAVGLRVYSAILAAALVMTLAGAWNARHLQVRRLNLTLAKKQGRHERLRVVMASDIHIGALLPPERFHEIARLINQQDPDVALIVGDLFDEDVTRLNREELIGSLQALRSRYGAYAVLGNHDYFADVRASMALMEKGGLKVLRDEGVRVNDAFYLLGRDDRQSVHMKGSRAALAQLKAALPDDDLPVVLMDHQPFGLQEAEAAGVALQLSGHTHHGQIWPFQWITRRIYEISWGYGRRGETQYYVSSGAGSWGPPVRRGNRPEIVVFDLTFQ